MLLISKGSLVSGAARATLPLQCLIFSNMNRRADVAEPATIGLEISSSPGYRVRSLKSSETWENFIDANTGSVKGAEIASSLQELDGEDRVNIIVLKSARAVGRVRVAEK